VFSSLVHAVGPGFTATVDVTALPMLGGDEEPMGDGSIYGTVTAYRTHASMVLGVLTAVAWLFCAGGELSGTGLKRYFGSEEVDDLLEILRPASGITGRQAVAHA
jgi:hypothetical protein